MGNCIFLTDDEQDINKEIKEIKPDPEIVMRELRSYRFDGYYMISEI